MAVKDPKRHVLSAKITHNGRTFYKASFVQTPPRDPAPIIDTWHLAEMFCNQWSRDLRRNETWDDNTFRTALAAIAALMRAYHAIPKEERRSGIGLDFIKIAVDTATQRIEPWDGQ